ncbi:MAG: NADH-quinone oxidoreductase subunit J [Deltaproteobacteria bacterium]|nr:NADH-quinone oxidoreductase subunit J [Deltaproteobacteria bacterium]HDZ90030.1 NADH-quinone oxidoreductase subunit J [Deltaproteobacteria bacterium]
MEILAKSAFLLYTLVIVTGSVMAVSARGLVRALLGLMGVMIGVAGMYLLMAAPFVAFMQVLIYVGGVGVLIFFAIMLTRADAHGDESGPGHVRSILNALLALLAPGVILSVVILNHPPASISEPADVGVFGLGKGMLEPYLLPFELISIILFVAMAGAVLVAWRRWGEK